MVSLRYCPFYSCPNRDDENAVALTVVVSSPVQKVAADQVHLVDVKHVWEEHDAAIDEVQIQADHIFPQTFVHAPFSLLFLRPHSHETMYYSR